MTDVALGVQRRAQSRRRVGTVWYKNIPTKYSLDSPQSVVMLKITKQSLTTQ